MLLVACCGSPKREPRRGPGLNSLLTADRRRGYVPVPDSDTPSGVLAALVAMLTFADLLAAAVGVNVTRIVHDAPAFRLAGQLFV